jgi:hypothetical protein
MTEIKVDKGVPVPKRYDHTRHTQYPFSSMEIGDSFLLPCEKKDSVNVVSKLHYAAKLYRKTKDKDFHYTTKYVKKEEGIRVWKIEPTK